MLFGRTIGATGLAAMLGTVGCAQGFDRPHPDWRGQWGWGGSPELSANGPDQAFAGWDQTKPWGLEQQAPLTPEYQAVLEASLADQAAGGQGGDTRYTCVSTGMPRMMTPVRPIEFVVLPDITYVMFENNMPR